MEFIIIETEVCLVESTVTITVGPQRNEVSEGPPFSKCEKFAPPLTSMVDQPFNPRLVRTRGSLLDHVAF